MKLKIEYLPLETLKPYANNAKLHPAEQVEQIKQSIRDFGFNDPIAIWGDDSVIEGHGRLIAATELGIDKVPVIRLDGLTDEQRRAYSLVHNKLTLNSGFDFAALQDELRELDDFNMADFGFSDFELGNLNESFEPDPYDKNIEDLYPETGLLSYNVIISCMSEDDKEFLAEVLKEPDRLRRTYDCATIRDRYENT